MSATASVFLDSKSSPVLNLLVRKKTASRPISPSVRIQGYAPSQLHSVPFKFISILNENLFLPSSNVVQGQILRLIGEVCGNCLTLFGKLEGALFLLSRGKLGTYSSVFGDVAPSGPPAPRKLSSSLKRKRGTHSFAKNDSSLSSELLKIKFFQLNDGVLA